MDRTKAVQQAKSLVAQMTLEEKAGQLRYDAPAIPRLGVPAYNWWNEALHGVARAGTATSFPQAIGLAAMFDDELLEKLGDAAATEGRAKYNAYSKENDRDIFKGLTFWSPNINIFRDPRWGRGHETYGEDPYLTSRLGQAYVRGLQGTGPVMKAAACAKHFAVHSGPENLRHRFNAEVTPKDMEETYLPAFQDCVMGKLRPSWGLTTAQMANLAAAAKHCWQILCAASGVFKAMLCRIVGRFGIFMRDTWSPILPLNR